MKNRVKTLIEKELWTLRESPAQILSGVGPILVITFLTTMVPRLPIMARELGIPCVVGVDVEAIREGDDVIVDGSNGIVYVRNPRKILRNVELWKCGYVDNEVVKRLRSEYLRALEELSPEDLEKAILKAFSLVRKLYPSNPDGAFNVYYIINELMEEVTPKVLAERFNIVDVFSRADRGEQPRNKEEEKLFKIYRLLKAFINYTDERVADIPSILFGV
ncbi:PEP-utilizing enzyme [Thermococcus stetteri]|uniref:PEP-utilizing enzyme n=1 Tax=Thermococcus stetteri TaxID=49900 RepID=UPI001AE2CAB7|nr:PEP-utilizing enzyme [Thermococcus stetteri]MBP1912421.1 hypothetical protein [Thermococcus stetteri]